MLLSAQAGVCGVNMVVRPLGPARVSSFDNVVAAQAVKHLSFHVIWRFRFLNRDALAVPDNLRAFRH